MSPQDAIAQTVIKGVTLDSQNDGLPRPGERLGQFELKTELGRGGMGVVYLAQQTEPVERVVALKLMRAKIVSEGAMGYFLAERQALAQMRHPAIAQIYEAGTLADGRPYLAMELIEGSTIDEYILRKKLPLDQRLRLFADLCRGVHHAHLKGVIHRDIKPSNVLVTEYDGRAQPKLIDFGIALARPTDGELQESIAATDRAGTKAYMSPEQAGLIDVPIDIRSDVYALGVLLSDCVGLIDSTVPGTFTLAKMSRPILPPTISKSDTSPAPAAPPMQLVHGRPVPSELRAIIAHATHFERDERYESANELALEIERFLRHEPIQVGPKSARYRAQKFAQRNLREILVTSVVTAALVGGAALAVSGWLAARAEQARTQLALERTEALSGFLRNMLASVDPDVAGTLDKALLRMVLDEAALRVDQEFANRPDVNQDLQLTIGKTYAALAEFDRGAKHLARAAALSASNNDVAAARAVRRAQLDLAIGRGDSKDAKALIAALRDPAISGPLDAADALALAHSEAQMRWQAGDYNASLAQLEPLRQQSREVLGLNAAMTANIELSIGAVLVDKGEYAKSEAVLSDLLQRVKANGVSGQALAVDVSNSLAIALMEQKQYARAAEVLRQGLTDAEAIYGVGSPRTTQLISNLAGALRQSGALAESGPYYERALEMARTNFGENTLYTAVAYSNLGNFWRESGDIAAAEKNYQRSQEVLAAGQFLAHPFAAMIGLDFGEFLIAHQRFDEAKKLLARGQAVLLAKLGADNERTRANGALLAQAERGKSR